MNNTKPPLGAPEQKKRDLNRVVANREGVGPSGAITAQQNATDVHPSTTAAATFG